MWRRRQRTWGRWACTLVSLLIAAVWAGSLWLRPCWRRGADPGRCEVVAIEFGTIKVVWIPPATGPREPIVPRPGAHWGSRPGQLLWTTDWKPEFVQTSFGNWIVLPLYIPLALALAPTSLLWWREVRRRRGAERGVCGGCGYDRSGLGAEAKCPECGAVATK